MLKNRANPILVGLLSLLLGAPAFAQGGGLNAAGDATANAQAVAGAAEPSRTQTIYEMAFQTLAAENVPGYAIAIVKDGNPVFRSTFGMADVQAKRKVNKDTIFGLASLTKTFTGMALLHLVDEGKLRPEDTLDKYLKNIPPAWQKLTIFQLASMRAGLPASREDELPWPEEMAYLKKQPLESEPGTQYVYSNPSYRILGSVIESITGMPYLDYISNVILSPLGMKSTGTTETMAPTGHVSCQYVLGRDGPAHQIEPKNPITSFSAGMLASSLDDLCTYASALMSLKILRPASYKTYFLDRPPLANGKPDFWAWGWGSNINKRLGTRVISMNGGLPGVASTILLVPDQNLAIVALSNLRSKAVYSIPRRAMMIYLTGQDVPQQPGQDGGGQNSEGSSRSNASDGP